MPVYGFADLAEFDRAKAAIRAMEEFLQRGQESEARYESPAATVVIKPTSALGPDDGPAPTDKGVYLGKVVYRDFTVSDPDASGAWVEPAGPFVEVFGPNKEPLAIGTRLAGRVVGVSTIDPFRARIQITGGAGVGLVPVRMMEADDPQAGRVFAQARLASSTAAGNPTFDTGAEVLLVRPLNGPVRTVPQQTPFTQYPQLRQGAFYVCWDSGVREAATGRRKVWAVTPPMKRVRVVHSVRCDPLTGRLDDSDATWELVIDV